MNYKEYLLSPEWQKVRTQRLKIDDFRCARCGSCEHLEVHHLNYRRKGKEDVRRDLVTLCRDCHAWIEDEKKFQKWKKTRPPVKPIELDDLQLCFIEKLRPLDIRFGGNLDLLRDSAIKPLRENFAKEQGILPDILSLRIAQNELQVLILNKMGSDRKERIRRFISSHKGMTNLEVAEATGESLSAIWDARIEEES